MPATLNSVKPVPVERPMSKMQYCWRCRMEIPMLDEHEWERVSRSIAYQTRDRGKAALTGYNGITGFEETNPNAI